MKKLLIIGPILSEWSEINFIKKTLQFLIPQYELDFLDPLINLTVQTERKNFFAEWYSRIELILSKYDAFFGFSLGGVIIQQCLPLFERQNKPVLFFSVPSFSDKMLSTRLREIINLIRQAKITEAINRKKLYVYVICVFSL
jgi:hypothetical protein